MAAGQKRRKRSVNRYAKLLERIFHGKHSFRGKHSAEKTRIEFARDEITEAAAALGLPLPKNLGDVIYTFRYRAPLPESIRATAPDGSTWIIEPAGVGRYRFALGMIAKYAFGNEQGVLARIRYNRLLDVFLGIACYSLQNHFRTTILGTMRIVVQVGRLRLGSPKFGGKMRASGV